MKQTVNWEEAQRPLAPEDIPPKQEYAGHMEMFVQPSPRIRVLRPVEIKLPTLAELGLPLKYAKDPRQWADFDAGTPIEISTGSYPYQDQFNGDVYTAQELYDLTPAFRESYATPEEMMKAITSEMTNRL